MAVHDGMKFKCEYRRNNSEALLLGDSLLRKVSMAEVDKIFFLGTRADEVEFGIK